MPHCSSCCILESHSLLAVGDVEILFQQAEQELDLTLDSALIQKQDFASQRPYYHCPSWQACLEKRLQCLESWSWQCCPDSPCSCRSKGSIALTEQSNGLALEQSPFLPHDSSGEKLVTMPSHLLPRSSLVRF